MTAVPGATQQTWQGLFRENLALFASVALTALLALKLLIISGFNVVTAAGVLQVAGTGSVVVGTVVTLGPTLVLIALGEVWLRTTNQRRAMSSVERSSVQMAAAPVVGVLILAVPMLSAAVYISVLFLVPRALGVVSRLVHLRRERRGQPHVRVEPMSSTERTAVRWAFPMFVLATVMTATWLPTESLGVGQHPAETGYVIGTRGAETVVLKEKPVRLESVPTAELKREYCETRSWWTSPVIDLLSGRKYPECP